VRIANKTHWRTDQIAALIRRVARDELDPGQLKDARVTVRYARGKRLGSCTYGTPRRPHVFMTLCFPRKGNECRLAWAGAPMPVLFAKVIAHELAHARGLRHRWMNNNRYGWAEGWKERYAYAKDFPLEPKPEPTKEEKLAKRRRGAVTKAEAKVAEWERAGRLARTKLRKWNARLRAAQRRATAAPQSAPSGSSP